jgi:hypothetical protein
MMTRTWFSASSPQQRRSDKPAAAGRSRFRHSVLPGVLGLAPPASALAVSHYA